MFFDILVLHADNPTFMAPKRIERVLDYHIAGELCIHADGVGHALESAFAVSQNLDDPWCNPTQRSTSVGDILCNKASGEFFMIENVGLRQIVDDDAERLRAFFVPETV